MTRTSLIALAVSTFCATVFGFPASARPATPAAGCAELGGTVQADQTCHIETKTATYSIDVSYPLGYSDQQAVTAFVDKDRNEFLDFITTLPPRDWPYEHGVRPHTFTSGTAASGTQSVVLELYGDTGAHPVTGFHSFNYDVSTHSPITFDALFKPGADPVAALDPIVQREMDKHWQGYGGPAPHNTLRARTYQNFALTDEAVIFYIPQGMWLAEVAGPQQISIPKSELASVLA
ncbi:esterase [Mycobacterium sp.]|uniref:esterase n=1 Tax=Mycobacterium sp. TaxID=1785 RepID=UPI003BB1272D